MYSTWAWTFSLTTFVQALIILAFESYVFGIFQSQLVPGSTGTTQALTITTFLTLYIFGFIYQLLLVWDALRLKNTLQVFGLVLYNIGLLIYGAVQLGQIKDAVAYLASTDHIEGDNNKIWAEVRAYLTAIPCILGLGTVLMAFVAWKLYDEFAWTIYKHISADLRMKRRYLAFQVYIALLKFDFFFFLGFTVQFVVIVQHTGVEFALTIAAIPITIVILIAAAFFCRHEIMIGTIGVIILYLGGLTYFIFKLVRMYEPSHEEHYLPARKELTTFAVLTILLILATISNAILCAANYNKGLRPYVQRRRVNNLPDKLSTAVGGSSLGGSTGAIGVGGVGSNLDSNYSAYATYTSTTPQKSHLGGVGYAQPTIQRMEID